MATKGNVSTNENDITDLNNKMLIVFKVVQTCIKEKDKKKDNIVPILDRLVSFTGLPKHILTKVCESTKLPEPTDKHSYTGFESPDINLARQAVITHYMNYKKIPTVKSMQATFPNASPLQIRQFLKRNGFIWKRVPNTKRAIIIERPERVIQRQRYLQQMDYYRRQKRSIVYIEEKIIDKNLLEYNYFEKHTRFVPNAHVVFIAVASKTGYISGTVLTASSVLRCQEIIEQNFTKNILPRLPKSSVIVLEDKPNLCTSVSMRIPTIESEKSSMMNWLKINNIPYDESSHRCELLELIENCRVKTDLHEFEAMVNARGHQILRRPQKTQYLNYFKLLWRDLFNTSDKSITNDMIKHKPLSYWLDLENNLIANEKVVYKEDLDVEDVIDKILTMAQDEKYITEVNKWADDELDEESDTLKQEEYLINCTSSL